MTDGIEDRPEPDLRAVPPPLRSDWWRGLADPTAFAEEQQALRHVWTFLGLASDAAGEDDWFRASLAGRSVFVQRVDGQLKGFENRCAHRFFPLRTQDKGSGPIVCGFHAWRYDGEGRATGIPGCMALFGVSAADLDARLQVLDVETCGAFVFARFPSANHTETLRQYLGDGFGIFEAMSQGSARAKVSRIEGKLNWRLGVHITLDDYHLQAIHPTSVGKNGPLKRENLGYYRFGAHSVFFQSRRRNALVKMVKQIRDGVWRPADYRILNIFPNLVLVHTGLKERFWFVHMFQHVPLAHDRSELWTWTYPSPFISDAPWHDRWTRPLLLPIMWWIFDRLAARVQQEDRQACERLQTTVGQVDGPPILGRMEERLAWFEEAYAAALRGQPQSSVTPTASPPPPAPGPSGRGGSGPSSD